MNATEKYLYERDEQVKENRKNKELEIATRNFTEHLVRSNYTKNFTWMGVPILQYPSDLMVMQELIWKVKPRIIIETGLAFGGSLLFYMDMINMAGGGYVFSIEIDPRAENLKMLDERMSLSVNIIKGSSIDKKVFKDVSERVEAYTKDWDGPVLVSLDSNHTASHVLQELRLYAPLVSLGSYVVVMDTAIEFYGHLDKNQNRPWHKGNSPYTAVQEFMKNNEEFIIDKDVEQRALLTAAPSGFLRRIKKPK